MVSLSYLKLILIVVLCQRRTTDATSYEDLVILLRNLWTSPRSLNEGVDIVLLCYFTWILSINEEYSRGTIYNKYAFSTRIPLSLAGPIP
jgi:hypothetical protein